MRNEVKKTKNRIQTLNQDPMSVWACRYWPRRTRGQERLLYRSKLLTEVERLGVQGASLNISLRLGRTSVPSLVWIGPVFGGCKVCRLWHMEETQQACCGHLVLFIKHGSRRSSLYLGKHRLNFASQFLFLYAESPTKTNSLLYSNKVMNPAPLANFITLNPLRYTHNIPVGEFLIYQQ